MKKLNISERRACRAITNPDQRKDIKLLLTNDEVKIRNRVIELARKYGRYGYKRISALLWQEGYIVNKKRVEIIWREEELKVPYRQPKKSR
ncbi:MAG: transposase [Bdellovibrionaceae bacterium]|nr:transposase [Bdellovibrio sp.]